MDPALPAIDGDFGPRAPIAVHPGWVMVRPAGSHLGVQHRDAARTTAGAYRARNRKRSGVLACCRRRAVDRPQDTVAAASFQKSESSGVAHSLGSDCRSDPGNTSVCGRLIMLCKISPTIER